jgi:hypothetical protein
MEATLLDSWPDNDNDPNGGTSGLAASKAMKNRGEISAYHHITSADELITTLLDVGTVCVGTNWYNSMFKPYSAYGNSYLNVDQMSGVAGGHEFLANGINLMPAAGEPYVRMKNSWGHYTWPGSHSGTARILLDDLFSLVFDQGGDAILITEV